MVVQGIFTLGIQDIFTNGGPGFISLWWSRVNLLKESRIYLLMVVQDIFTNHGPGYIY